MKNIEKEVGLRKEVNPHIISWRYNNIVCRDLGYNFNLSIPLKLCIKAQTKDIVNLVLMCITDEISKR